MSALLRLPMKVAGLAAGAARTSLHLAEAAAEATMERVRARRGRDDDAGEPAAATDGAMAAPAPVDTARAAPAADAVPASPPPAPPPSPGPPPPAAEAPDAPPLTVVPEPTRGQAARIRAEQREAERTEDSPGPQIRVDEPWSGYAAMNAPEIIDRLRASDDAVKGVVLLYERSHRNRKTVVRAAGG